jgi:addiction module RelE/StbE family toxin
MAIWAPQALADLKEAWDYIAEENEPAADRILATIETAGNRLERFPFLGRPGRAPGSRELTVPRTRYFLVYYVQPAGVEIARVVHSARQWPPKG